jgi:hypothetical protein
METTSVFDRLVEELSREERRKLLSQIEDTVVLSAEPLQAEPEPETETEADSQLAFQNLNGFVRFLFRLKGLFSGKTGLEAYEESLLARIKKEIARRAPKIADFRHGVFLERMKTALEGLKASADFFLPYLLPPSERVRSEFIAFLARRRCEPLMKRLEDETDPRTIVTQRETATESDLKAEMDRRFLEIVGELPEEDRKALYLDCQSLDYLKAFAETDFDSIIGRFALSRLRGAVVCSFGEVAKRLLELADVLKSARLPPSKPALEALFLFAQKKELAGENELADFLQREFLEAENALARIREFNRNVPLDLLARVLANDCNYRPAGLTGGEDWFVLFKKYWAARLHAVFKNYVQTLRTTAVMEKAFALLGVRRFEEIKNYHPAAYDPKLVVAHWRSLSFILAFSKNMFTPKFLKSLKTLFLNGEFYKTENRIAFADVFNFLSTLGEKLLFFERRLAPAGEIGKAMAEVRAENVPPQATLKKLEPLLKRADAEALSLTEKTIDALKTLNKILNGILFAEAGGKFDTLSNLGYVGGKENEALRKDWERIIALSYEASLVLQELVAVESPS